MSIPPSRLSSVFRELKHRKVFQAATGYAVVAWIVRFIGSVRASRSGGLAAWRDAAARNKTRGARGCDALEPDHANNEEIGCAETGS